MNTAVAVKYPAPTYRCNMVSSPLSEEMEDYRLAKLSEDREGVLKGEEKKAFFNYLQSLRDEN